MSSVGEHAPDVKSIVERLQAAVDAAAPTRGQSRYTEVHVLMLYWKDDDLGVASEIRDLASIFIKTFHYLVESWEIPSEKPTRCIQERMNKFLKYDSLESLLIVYYAGHAIQNEQCSEPPIWIS